MERFVGIIGIVVIFMIVYFMSNNQDYILLLFVGDKDIMFPTFRKNNKENAELYGESVGELFKIQIENP